MVEAVAAQRGRRLQLEYPLTAAHGPSPDTRHNEPVHGTPRPRKGRPSPIAQLLAGALACLCVASCGATKAPTAQQTKKTTLPTPAPSANATTTTPSPTASPYSWTTEAVPLLGGGATSTLSALVAPAAGNPWLVAGSVSTAHGTAATIWTSTDSIHWHPHSLLPPTISTPPTASSPSSGTSGSGPSSRGTSGRGTPSAALAATNWGRQRIVVGSEGLGSDRHAAVWISPGPGQRFSPVTDSGAFYAPGAPGAPQGPSTTRPTTTTTTATSAGTPPSSGAYMSAVGGGALGLFAAGAINGQAALWYSRSGQNWQILTQATRLMDLDPQAVVNQVLSTPGGIFVIGSSLDGTQLAGVAWYSSDGIHWSTTGGTFASPGDHLVSALVDLNQAGSSPSGASLSGLLAVGAYRSGPQWGPASWISPDGFSWSDASESFALDSEPPLSPGAAVYAAGASQGRLYAVGGSPQRQRVWSSTDGLTWQELPLPEPAAAASGWHLGLVAASGPTVVVADNLAGQPYLLSYTGRRWLYPSPPDVFGRPLPTAVPSQLVVDVAGHMTMAVAVTDPGTRPGTGRRRVVILRSSGGKHWSIANADAFPRATLMTLSAVPGGLVAAGSVGGHAFAALSTDGAKKWGTQLINPSSAGAPGPSAPQPVAAPSPGSAAATTVPAASTTTTPGQNAPAPSTTSVPATTAPAQAATTTTTAPVLAGGGAGAITTLAGPLAATTAGRVGTAQFVVGQAGPYAVDWYGTNGVFGRPSLLDQVPQLADETPIGSCTSGDVAVVVGSLTTTALGAQPVAWSSTNGASWTAGNFSPAPTPGSTTAIYGCLTTGNGFIAYGETNSAGGTQQPAIWTSPDGVSWQQQQSTFTGAFGGAPTGPEVAPLQVIALEGTTWLGVSGGDNLPGDLWPSPVAGAAAGPAPVTPGLWTSLDAGNTWQQVMTELPVFGSTYFAQADVAQYSGLDPVVAGCVDGRLTIWFGTKGYAGK